MWHLSLSNYFTSYGLCRADIGGINTHYEGQVARSSPPQHPIEDVVEPRPVLLVVQLLDGWLSR